MMERVSRETLPECLEILRLSYEASAVNFGWWTITRLSGAGMRRRDFTPSGASAIRWFPMRLASWNAGCDPIYRRCKNHDFDWQRRSIYEPL